MNPVVSRQFLLNSRCRALSQGAYLALEIEAQLAELPGWAYRANAIERRFTFRDYPQTIGFVNAVAWMAQAEDHHPELLVTSRHCLVRWDTHSVGGVSLNDFICAVRCDALHTQAG